MAYKPASHNGALAAYLDELANNKDNARQLYSLEESIAHLDLLPPPPPIADYDGHSSSGTCSPTQTDYAPPSSASSLGPWPIKTRFNAAQQSRTLRLPSVNAGRQGRFQALFETALSPRVPARESARFLDRFRYILCTSQLLSDRIVTTGQQPHGRDNRERRTPSTFQFDAEEQASWDEKRVAKYWMGSGGCVLLVSLLLVWSLKRKQKGTKMEKERSRATMTLFLSLLLARYLWAQSRRGYRRLLHVRAADRCEQVVLHCQLLDNLCSRALRQIDESDAIPGLHARNATRSTLTACLNLLYSAFDRSFATLQDLASASELSKLAEMYNITLGTQSHQDNEDALLCSEDVPVTSMRALLHGVHQRRRKLLCCLLAIQADGRADHTAVWRTVVEQLSGLSQLTASLGRQIEDVLHARSLETALVRWSLTESTHGYATISHTLRRTQAKMHSLRQHTLQWIEAADGTPSETIESDAEAREALSRQYDALGDDLEALMTDWKHGKDILSRLSNRQIASPSAMRTLWTEQASDTHVRGRPSQTSSFKRPDSLGFWGPRISILAPNGIALDQRGVNRGLGLEQVYEGYGDQQPPEEDRAAQIAAMRAERALKQARTAMRMQAQSGIQSQSVNYSSETWDASEKSDDAGRAKQPLQQRQVTFAQQSHERPQSIVGQGQGRRPRGLRLSIGIAPQPQQQHGDRRSLALYGDRADSIPARTRFSMGTVTQAAAAAARKQQQQHAGQFPGIRQSLVRNVSSGSDGSALSLATWTTAGDSALGASTSSYGSRF